MPVTEQTTTVRETILKGCERALAKFGYRRMTMDDVAEAARLSRRTIYLHFPNKEALVDATILQAIANTQAAMEEPLNLGTGLEALRGMIVTRILVRLEHVGPFHHSIDDVNRDLYPHDSEEDRSFYEPEVLLLEKAINKGIEDGSIAPVEARSVAELVVRSSNGFLPSNLTPAEVASVSLVKAKLELFADMLCYGIAAGKTL